jgi:hypothetical protein
MNYDGEMKCETGTYITEKSCVYVSLTWFRTAAHFKVKVIIY